MNKLKRKLFTELNSEELSLLLTEYRTHKVITSYGWLVPFSIKDFYSKQHKGFYHDNV